MRTTVIAALLAVCLTGGAAAAGYVEMALGELLHRLPTIFGQQVIVRGTLTGWGDVAALASEVTREVMVDLRPLDEAARRELNRICTADRQCAATVKGKVAHIRGTGISELGIEAESIEFEPIVAAPPA